MVRQRELSEMVKETGIIGDGEGNGIIGDREGNGNYSGVVNVS